jgi:hypothetical protein
MKQIINGKKYDTETANYLGFCEIPTMSGFRNRITLYRKKDGEYFLYSYLQEPGWIGDSTVSLGISPLTDEKAKKFAEGYLSVQRYEAIFGAVQE